MTEERRIRGQLPSISTIICDSCGDPLAVISVCYEHGAIREELCETCFVNYYPILTKDQEPQPF